MKKIILRTIVDAALAMTMWLRMAIHAGLGSSRRGRGPRVGNSKFFRSRVKKRIFPASFLSGVAKRYSGLEGKITRKFN